MTRLGSLAALLLLVTALALPAGADASTTAPLFTDPEGDATGFVQESTPLPSQPSLDLVEGTVDYDHDRDALVFTVGVLDLTGTPAAGALGNTYYVNFSARGQRFYAVATQHLVDGDSFELGTFDATTGTRAGLGDIDGSFDAEADTATLVVPASVLAENGALLRPGDRVTSDGLLAQRYIGSNLVGGATPTADAATGRTYTIPHPDADGDGVRADTDCDDADPEVGACAAE